MTSQETDIKEWELEAIQKRYHATHGLNLTVDQAKMIYEYEQLRDTTSNNHYFSLWEEFDFELVSFQRILTSEQFETYKINHLETIRHNEEQLVRQDQEYVKQQDLTKDMLHYYESQLLPDFEKQRMFIWQSFVNDKEKVDYLKAEYKKFLCDTKKFILVNHFRHSKTLQPNLLQLSLLHHQLICLLPDYYSFRVVIDAPTRGIADYLESKLKRATEMIKTGLNDTLQAFKEFKKANTARHLGEIRGWHTIVANEEDNFMFMLLLDRQKYGC